MSPANEVCSVASDVSCLSNFERISDLKGSVSSLVYRRRIRPLSSSPRQERAGAATVDDGMPMKKEAVGSQEQRNSQAGSSDAVRDEGDESCKASSAHASAHRSSQAPYATPGPKNVILEISKGNVRMDSEVEVASSLSGNPSSSFKVSQASLKVAKTGTQEQKFCSQHQAYDVSRDQAGTSQTIKDRKSENTTKAWPVSEHSSRGYAGMMANQGNGGLKQAANNHLNADAAITEVAKKVRLRVKRARLPVKPKLLRESADELEEGQISHRKNSNGGVTGDSYRDTSVSKNDDDDAASAKGNIEKGSSDREEASGVFQSAGLPGITFSSGSELGGTTATCMSGHTEVESDQKPAHGVNASSQASTNVPPQNDFLDSCSGLHSATNYARNELPSISHHTSSNSANIICTPEVAAVSPNSQRSSSHKSVAPVGDAVVLMDGYSSEKDCTFAQTSIEEEVSRENTTNELKDFSLGGRKSTRDPEIPPPERSLPVVLKDCSDLTARDGDGNDDGDGAASEPSGFDMKQQSVLETLELETLDFSDEPPEYEVSESRESQQYERANTGSLFKCFSPCTPGRGFNPPEQVPCDAEAKTWHPDVEKQSGKEVSRRPSTLLNSIAPEQLFSAANSHHKTGEDCAVKRCRAPEPVPSTHLNPLHGRIPSSAEYTVNRSLEPNRGVEKERSVFIGCIPEGIENVQEVLQNLMEKFIGRFDFVPSILSHIHAVKVCKDYAFVEFAMDKVAQIVLAADHANAFERGANGSHFNLEGCQGTYTSVRPLIEFMPLKPARVLLIGNIPKSRWEEEYLKVFFCKILQGSEESTDMKLVASVHLLPESFDAYVELASELIADAVVYKCTKNTRILKGLGEDTFICRHTNVIPLMSKHTSSICPQRALFVGITQGGEKLNKIECIRKVFEEILHRISGKGNHHGYIEYISLQPGMDCAFFQFNSEAITDAIMDEYIENTQLFSARGGPRSYIILRPPHYIRSGAKYRSDLKQVQSELFRIGSDPHQMNKEHSKQACQMQTEKDRGLYVTKQGHEAERDTNNRSDDYRNRAGSGRRIGSDAGKKVDVVMSFGSAPQLIAPWNWLSSPLDCSIDSKSVIVVRGLVRGLSYKLLRGALNELFERALSNSGLLQVGMQVLTFLDRDYDTANDVACLPNAEFANALLSSRKSFKLSGKELRLLPKDPRKSSHWRWNPSNWTGGRGEMSCFVDEEEKISPRSFSAQEWTAPSSSWERKRLHSETESPYHSNYETSERDSNTRLKQTDRCVTELNKNKRLRSSSSEALKKESITSQFKEGMQRRNGANEQARSLSGPCSRDDNSPFIATTEKMRKQGSITKDKVSKVSLLKRQSRSFPVHNKNAGTNSKNDYLEDSAKKCAADDNKKTPTAGNPPYLSERGKHAGEGCCERASSTKRLRSEVVKDGLVQNLEPGQARHRKYHRYVQQETLEHKQKPKLPSLDVPVNLKRKSKHQGSVSGIKSTGMIQQGLNYYILHIKQYREGLIIAT